jgi:hypothetical protein
MCFVWISEQTAVISLYSINWLVFITDGVCLLRGTDWMKIFVTNLHVLMLPRKQLHTTDCRSGSCVWTPGRWLEVSRHPEGPATCRINTGFPCLTSVREQVTEIVGRAACFPTLPWCCPPNTKLSPYSSLVPSAAFSQPSISHHATVFTSQRFTLFLAYLHQKDERALRRNLKTPITFYCHPSP